ncbi:3'-5' exonuclease [Hankyongella ginsenosidimutans]|uniref:3'-5' exonuclease n=1 Tax=Hankyongella ginsenosidimutans TaxID=1763828 RepID=UPI001CA32B44|nr:3'-5' exonuclease [Hankyongella ginsenosidimutans]
MALLLDLALKFEADNSPALQGFLGELEASERDIKRDPDAPRDEVRLMTAHGAKGLQAPIVILADASRPFKAQVDHVLLKGQLPLWAGGKSRFVGPLAQPYAVEAEKQRQEHWRLLYVALTRAEDWLFVAGWKPRKADGADPWYGVVRAALEGLGAATMADPLWGDVLVHETAQAAALPTLRLSKLPLQQRRPCPAGCAAHPRPNRRHRAPCALSRLHQREPCLVTGWRPARRTPREPVAHPVRASARGTPGGTGCTRHGMAGAPGR